MLLSLVLLAYIREPKVKKYGYNTLLDTDSLNIYHKNELVATVEQPGQLFETYNEVIIPVYEINPLQLRIRRFSMKEMYRLEFVKNGKPFIRIKVLTPRSQRGVEKIYRKGADDIWMKMEDYLVVLNETYHYFQFSRGFYKNLAEVLRENGK